MNQKKWSFWIDRGGTFTDIVAKGPKNKIVVKKFLSQNDKVYKDAASFGILNILNEYNQLNNNTMFKGNVNIVYSIYKINSEVVNLDFERNLIEIYENIVLKSINNRLYADKVILNMINKNLKILKWVERNSNCKSIVLGCSSEEQIIKNTKFII